MSNNCGSVILTGHLFGEVQHPHVGHILQETMFIPTSPGALDFSEAHRVMKEISLLLYYNYSIVTAQVSVQDWGWTFFKRREVELHHLHAIIRPVVAYLDLVSYLHNILLVFFFC